ncbi:MAG TPA: preprotein translocase subunit YajC [Candidatus Sabulitectum sp.]|nr:preprotein translocase subunit YajC [Candidatus Sabulitectum sp.]HPF32714.1 preprotein translocase subunit YajC [Candidatus Sabulitectum sp.]HPJ28413.1 preprotein translocase subunit YajC [Candidatus Sabulitectum sp.]HPR22049.1 preprotein translocase subunit YajC [Candidatus Sabulitectum sp.]
MRIRNTVLTVIALGASALAQDAPAAEEAAPAGCMGSGGITGLLPIVAMVAIFYFLIIRPQQKQSKQLAQMRSSLQKGDRVVTSGGIHGVITNLKGDIITVRIAESVKIDVDRNALTLTTEEAPQE